jgi:NADP-dependent 3-hydroxy acid dehydrogenase YdfG
MLVRAALPLLKRKSASNIIIIGSEAALSGGKKGAVYSATKFALRGLVQALRDECGRAGVSVTLINPGMTRTPFFDDLNFAPGEDPSNYIEPADVAAAVDYVLQQRVGTVTDEINLSPLRKVIRFES